MEINKKFLKFGRLVKIDEATHTVYGIATEEVVDKDNEICDYLDSLPGYKSWSQEFLDATTVSGQDLSLGNIRIQHTPEMGGKVTELDFKDVEKQIWLGSQPKDEPTWAQIKGGFYTGYSQGGKYLYRKCNACKTDINGSGNFCQKCKKNVVVRYAAKPSEVSYVDNPCLETAHFAFVKSDGSTELVKFKNSISNLIKVQEPAIKSKEVKKKRIKKSMSDDSKKGPYTVAQFAELLQDISYLQTSGLYEVGYEKDDSNLDMSDSLKTWLEDGSKLLLSMVEEETLGLTAAEKAQKGEQIKMKLDEFLKAAKASLAAHYGKMATHHEKMAEHHLKAHESHQEMQDTCKEDSSGGINKELGSHHKTMSSVHERMHKMHKAASDHCAGMANAQKDMEMSEKFATPEFVSSTVTEANKTVLAEFAKSVPVVKTEPVTEPVKTEPVKTEPVVEKAASVAEPVEKAAPATEPVKTEENNVAEVMKSGLADLLKEFKEFKESFQKESEPVVVKTAGFSLVNRNGSVTNVVSVDDSGL